MTTFSPTPTPSAALPPERWACQQLAGFHQTILRNPWIPQKPHPKQAAFLLSPCLEILYGGAAGGGKSSALLMAAAQFVDVPGYAALLLRRSFPDLMQPDALIPRSKDWWMDKAHWSRQERRWTFPSGATITFGYLEHDDDVYQYQGAAYHFIGIDELTQHTEFRYTYLFSRLRRLAGMEVPLRIRAGSNPGGIGHAWVKDRFLESTEPGRIFLPARLQDNPSLDQQEYRASLLHLDPLTRQQLLDGDWVSTEGTLFKRAWFSIVDAVPNDLRKLRAWDLAATEPSKSKDPDWTVGVLLGKDKDNTYYLLDVRRTRSTPHAVQALVRQTAELDGRGVEIWMEEEGGASGKTVIEHFTRNVLAGWKFHGERSTGNKAERARPLASYAEAGNVKMLRADWNKALLDELEVFPLGAKDDQVDALALAFSRLSLGPWRKLAIF